MRGEMSILSEIKWNKDPKTRKARKDIRKYNITSANDIPSNKEKLKEKNASKTFQMDAKKSYREIGKKQVMVNEAPPKDSKKKFW